jgi:23S rRNA pseudouridine2605 synthase
MPMKNSSDADPTRRTPSPRKTKLPPRAPEAAAPGSPATQRIAKVMARSGLCSRRDAEEWILAGRVQVNKVTLTSPALNVGDDDEILVDGSPLRAKTRTRLFLFHKPRGYVTTAKDPQGRPTIYDLLPSDLPRLITIGRLDMNTEGLLMLTNDGGLARHLELPATGWLRRYRVRAHGEIDPAQLAELANGITVDGVNYGPIEATLDRVQGANVWLTLGLREGKNREVKRVLEHYGLAVNRLIRISFGPFQLAELDTGSLSEIKTRILKDQLGDDIARQAGLDFDAPLESERLVEAPVKERWARDQREPRPAGGARRDARGPDGIIETGETEKRRDRPEKGKRKHISVLRAERRAALSPQRTRVERTATADRKGREISVERLVTTKPGRAKNTRPPWRKPRDAARGGRDARPAETKSRTDRPSRGGPAAAERPQSAKAAAGKTREAGRDRRTGDNRGRPAQERRVRDGVPQDKRWPDKRWPDQRTSARPRADSRPNDAAPTGRAETGHGSRPDKRPGSAKRPNSPIGSKAGKGERPGDGSVRPKRSFGKRGAATDRPQSRGGKRPGPRRDPR